MRVSEHRWPLEDRRGSTEEHLALLIAGWDVPQASSTSWVLYCYCVCNLLSFEIFIAFGRYFASCWQSIIGENMGMWFSSEVGVSTTSFLITGIFKVFHLLSMFCGLEAAHVSQFLWISSYLTEIWRVIGILPWCKCSLTNAKLVKKQRGIIMH